LERGPLIVTQVGYNIGRNCYDVEKSEPVVFARVPCAEFEVRNKGQK